MIFVAGVFLKFGSSRETNGVQGLRCTSIDLGRSRAGENTPNLSLYLAVADASSSSLHAAVQGGLLHNERSLSESLLDTRLSAVDGSRKLHSAGLSKSILRKSSQDIHFDPGAVAAAADGPPHSLWQAPHSSAS